MAANKLNNISLGIKLHQLRTISLLAFFVSLFSIVFFPSVSSAPPSPHSISGTIFRSDGITQAASGTYFYINDTNTSYVLRSKTSHPIFSGRYAETISAADGDYILIRAWNASHYGEKNVTIFGNMNNVNVVINLTRPPELNITILAPSNGSFYNISDVFNLAINVTNIGSSSASVCNISLSISSLSIVDVNSGENYSRIIPSIPAHGSTNVSFSLQAVYFGAANISVSGACTTDGVNLAQADRDEISGINVVDTQAPVVTLLEPANNTLNLSSLTVRLSYQADDNNQLANCSLFIDGSFDQVNTSFIQMGQQSNFSKTLSNGNHLWYVRCVDSSLNVGISRTWNISIAVFVPRVQSVFLTNPVRLEEGITKTIFCNATATDDGGPSDIIKMNATLFHYDSSSPGNADDNNNHYTNMSCRDEGINGISKRFSCGFSIWYYANSGYWTCNITVMDASNNTNSSQLNTSVSDLYSITAQSPFFGLGFVAPGGISPSDNNFSLLNYGNKQINISVRGYGAVDGDNASFNCTVGYIPKGDERYSAIYNNAFDDMYNLSNQSALIHNLTMPQRIDDSNFGSDRNNTYWKIKVPTGVSGSCSGNLVFSLVVV